MARLTSQFLVDLLRRQAEAAGGFVTIIRRGDTDSGTILIETLENGAKWALMEPVPTLDGEREWRKSGILAADADAALARRVRFDPDLWVIELDIAQPERLIALWAAAT